MTCTHPTEAIYYNPFNRVTQCHKCGLVLPTSDEYYAVHRVLTSMLEAAGDVLVFCDFDEDRIELKLGDTVFVAHAEAEGQFKFLLALYELRQALRLGMRAQGDTEAVEDIRAWLDEGGK